jgi:hypothetical protein
MSLANKFLVLGIFALGALYVYFALLTQKWRTEHPLALLQLRSHVLRLSRKS